MKILFMEGSTPESKIEQARIAYAGMIAEERLLGSYSDEAAEAVRLANFRYDLRGLAAGQAIGRNYYREFEVRWNRPVLIANEKEFLAQTVPHELAHVALMAVYKEHHGGHGRRWKRLMLALGAKAQRCHEFEVKPARKLKTYGYACACTTHELTSVRHRKVLNGSKYRCRRCGQFLKAADVERKEAA